MRAGHILLCLVGAAAAAPVTLDLGSIFTNIVLLVDHTLDDLHLKRSAETEEAARITKRHPGILEINVANEPVATVADLGEAINNVTHSGS